MPQRVCPDCRRNHPNTEYAFPEGTRRCPRCGAALPRTLPLGVGSAVAVLIAAFALVAALSLLPHATPSGGTSRTARPMAYPLYTPDLTWASRLPSLLMTTPLPSSTPTPTPRTSAPTPPPSP